jgi:uncharacterized protein (TIGR02246 family)
MKGAIVLLSCSLLAALSAGLSAQEDATEKDAARELMAEVGRTWARHDPVALADLWLPDGDYVNAVGQRAQGREELVKLFRTEHLTYMKGTSLIISVTRSRVLAPGLMLVDATADLTGVQSPDGRRMTPFAHLLVTVAKQEGGRWRVVSARLSVPVPGAPGE